MDKKKFREEFNDRLVKFSLEIIKFCEAVRKNKNLRPIADQLIRSATSIGANVIEAKGATSKADYLRFFQIALGSANETKYWLILIKESAKNFEEKAEYLLKEVTEIANIIASGVITMKKSKV